MRFVVGIDYKLYLKKKRSFHQEEMRNSFSLLFDDDTENTRNNTSRTKVHQERTMRRVLLCMAVRHAVNSSYREFNQYHDLCSFAEFVLEFHSHIDTLKVIRSHFTQRAFISYFSSTHFMVKK